MDRPIFLIGAARSGTTIVAQILSCHPDIAFWNEPRYVWRHGNHRAIDDARTPEEATPPVSHYIRRRFERFLARSRRSRFLEKTPSNCFRVGFIDRVFPEGIFLHVQRDGRDAAASALGRWLSAPDDSAILRRLRGFEIPLTALHHYMPQIMHELVLRRLHPGRGYLWGPRYPGIHTDLERGRPIAEVCARQWAESEGAASAALAAIEPDRVFSFRYEDFVTKPEVILSALEDFAGLRRSPDLVQAARRLIFKEKGSRFQHLAPVERDRINAICLPILDRWAPARDGTPPAATGTPGAPAR